MLTIYDDITTSVKIIVSWLCRHPNLYSFFWEVFRGFIYRGSYWCADLAFQNYSCKDCLTVEMVVFNDSYYRFFWPSRSLDRLFANIFTRNYLIRGCSYSCHQPQDLSKQLHIQVIKAHPNIYYLKCFRYSDFVTMHSHFYD